MKLDIHTFSHRVFYYQSYLYPIGLKWFGFTSTVQLITKWFGFTFTSTARLLYFHSWFGFTSTVNKIIQLEHNYPIIPICNILDN